MTTRNILISCKDNGNNRDQMLDTILKAIKYTATTDGQPVDLFPMKRSIDLSTQLCCICSQVSLNIGIYHPHKMDMSKFGGSKKYQRGIFYGLCDECHKEGNFLDKVEASILAGTVLDSSQVH